MKVLKLRLHQNKANYGRPECVGNRMTYYCPFPSSIIGMIHSACNFTKYIDMNVSIHCNFESKNEEFHNYLQFYNSIQKDRGLLVKVPHENVLLHTYQKVSKTLIPKKSNHFEKKNLQIFNEDLLDKYINLVNLEKILSIEKKELKNKIKELKKEKLDTKTENDELKRIDIEISNVKEELDTYKTLEIQPTHIEVLSNIDLIIYVQVKDEKMLNFIYNHIYNLSYLGRSQDLIDIKEAKIIDIEPITKNIINREYLTYIPMSLINNNTISVITGFSPVGTIYYVSKKYEIENEKRIFKETTKCLLAKTYQCNKSSENLVFEDKEDNRGIIFI